MCRSYPLGLKAFKENVAGGERIVVDGALTCRKCKRWYPIIGEIPRMLPDDMRPNYGSFKRKYAKRFLE